MTMMTGATERQDPKAPEFPEKGIPPPLGDVAARAAAPRTAWRGVLRSTPWCLPGPPQEVPAGTAWPGLIQAPVD